MPVMNKQSLFCFCKMPCDRFILFVESFQLYVFSKIDAAVPKPFINGFLGAPQECTELWARYIPGHKREDELLIWGEKFIFYFFRFFTGDLDIDTDALLAAHDGGSVIAAMRDGELVLIIW